MAQQAGAVAEHRLLNPAISAGYRERRETVIAASGVRVIAEGSLRIDADGHGWATPTIVAVGVDDLLAQRSTLAEEAFGPLSIVVEYGDHDLVSVADELFDGNLTGTIHAAEDEDLLLLRPLIDWLVAQPVACCSAAGRPGWP